MTQHFNQTKPNHKLRTINPLTHTMATTSLLSQSLRRCRQPSNALISNYQIFLSSPNPPPIFSVSFSQLRRNHNTTRPNSNPKSLYRLSPPPITSTGKKRHLSNTNPSLYDSDLLVVLDMDECLIHSQFQSGAEYRQQESRPSSSGTTCESFVLELPDGDIVTVNKRPGIDEFLKKGVRCLPSFIRFDSIRFHCNHIQTFFNKLTLPHNISVGQKWETYIFTAAMEVYARPVLDVLDPNDELIASRFYRDSCTYNQLGVYVKDLSKIVPDDRDLKVSLTQSPLAIWKTSILATKTVKWLQTQCILPKLN